MLARTAVLICGDRSAGDDLLQDALVRTFRAWPRVRAEGALAYTVRVMTNLRTDRWRRSGREPIPVEAGVLERRAGPAAAESTVIDRDDILRRLAALNQRERTIVVLRYYHDLPEKDVAAELGVSVGTVKSTCSRALAKLRPLRGAEIEADQR